MFCRQLLRRLLSEGAEGTPRLIKQDFDTAYETVDAILTGDTDGGLPGWPQGGRSGDQFPERRVHRSGEPAGLPGDAVPAGLNAEVCRLGRRSGSPAPMRPHSTASAA